MKIKPLETYNSKLKSNPELHDKMSLKLFIIVIHLHLTHFDELKGNGFSIEEIKELKESLLNLTNSILVDYNKIVKSDMADIKELEIRRKKSLNLFKVKKNWESALSTAYDLIQDCKRLSTGQFLRVAYTFIAKSLFNSVKELGAISEEDYNLL